MKRALALMVLVVISARGSVAAEQCSASDTKADEHWASAICGGTPRKTQPPDPAPTRTVELPAPTRKSVGVDEWKSKVDKSYKLIVKSLEVGDIDELKRQSVDLRRQSSELEWWPKADNWTLARVYCTTMALELANFADDKLKASARGEIASEASIKAYRAADSECKRGIRKLK